MIIDFHTHAFPQRIAEKAIRNLAHVAGGARPNHDGTAEDLLRAVRAGGADRAVVLNIATNEKQQRNVNDFAIETNHAFGGALTAFGSVYPQSETALEELDRLRAAGIRGIKLHPDYQHFFVDDERFYPLYRRIGELGFVTVFHAGIDIGYPEPVHCTPQMLARILPQFSGAPVVAAHMGGWMMWKDVQEYLCGRDLYLDTAFSAGRMPPDYAREIIRRHGADRVLLGSDMPWGNTGDEIAFVRSLDLPDAQTAAILGENAQMLLAQ
ncbi:MAG: amidohydrolase family protein [Clostridia bacterium]